MAKYVICIRNADSVVTLPSGRRLLRTDKPGPVYRMYEGPTSVHALAAAKKDYPDENIQLDESYSLLLERAKLLARADSIKQELAQIEQILAKELNQ